MIKLLLSFILIISASLIGNSFSQKLVNRRRTLTSIVEAISRIKTLICFGGADVFSVIKESFCTDEFPLIDVKTLESSADYDVAFKKCVDKISSSFSLTKADKQLLAQFGCQLGTTDITGQIAHTELYAELFSERLSKVKEQENSKSKLYRVLGFSLGCAASLLIV